jgi:hypothetical protein
MMLFIVRKFVEMSGERLLGIRTIPLVLPHIISPLGTCFRETHIRVALSVNDTTASVSEYTISSA